MTASSPASNDTEAKDQELKVLAIGDSHSQYFGITPQLRALYPALGGVHAEVVPVHGSTIAGFGKRSSTLGTKNVIMDSLHSYSPDILVLNFGQVDVELGIPYRKYVKLEDTSVSWLIEGFSETYARFINELDFPPENIYIKGSNLSVLAYDRNKAIRYIKRIVTENIESPEEHEAIIERMRAAFPNDIERASVVSYFNQAIARSVKSIGASYFDINDDIRDIDTGLISGEFIPSGRDHHLVDSIAVRKIHWQALLKAIEASGLLPSFQH